MALAIIPARGGSKGIPRKNLQEVGGRSLICRSIEAALDAGIFSRIVVSSDDEQILDKAASCGAVADHRAADLAQDSVHASRVVMDYCERNEIADEEFVAMLLPTAPFRTAKNLIDGMALQWQFRDASVVAVTATGKYINNIRFIDNDRLLTVVSNPELNRQRQGQREIYFVTGSYFSSSWAGLRRAGTFHYDAAVPLPVSAAEGVDVNSLADLEYAVDYAKRHAL